MLGNCDIVSFIAISDTEKARAFYVDTLGLSFVSEDPYAVVFDANGVTLRAQKIEKVEARQGTVLGWHVPDIKDAVKKTR
jgi:catechol 2,3-dioxygenase-like lactoylglutathione lyase family enzyme